MRLVTSAALTTEAIKLASEGLARLRPLVEGAGAPDDLLQNMGKLCAGKHPSAEVLNRARNHIGFHWAKDVIGPPTREFGKNKKIVWMEAGIGHDNVHRLASDVLVHALFPEVARQTNTAAAQRAASEAMSHISDAMSLIIEFFAASAFGYLKWCGAVRKTAEPKRHKKKKTAHRKR